MTSQSQLRLNVSTNLWASIHKENSRVFPAGLQVVRLVYHPIKLEARFPRKVKDLRRIVIARATWKTHVVIRMTCCKTTGVHTSAKRKVTSGTQGETFSEDAKWA